MLIIRLYIGSPLARANKYATGINTVSEPITGIPLDRGRQSIHRTYNRTAYIGGAVQRANIIHETLAARTYKLSRALQKTVRGVWGRAKGRMRAVCSVCVLS